MKIFQNYLAHEFAEDYTEGRITRRQALKLIISVTGSALVANTILAACAPPPEATLEPTALPANTLTPEPTAMVEATATEAMPEPTVTEAMAEATVAPMPGPNAHGTVVPEDPAVQAGEIEFVGSDGKAVKGYLSQPADTSTGPFAVVLVCHENRGLTPHIQDVTRRLAKAGYIALAVDLLSRSGGTAALSSDEIPGILGNTQPEQFVADFRSGWESLSSNPAADIERVGMTGFCFGGGVTWRVATKMPELRAAMPFYGPHPPEEDIPGIQAPVLAIYGANDTRINAGIPAMEAAMKANGKIYETMIYEGADHAFFNDTSTRYNPTAAADAWSKMLNWFGTHLG